MDFSNRGAQPQNVAPSVQSSASNVIRKTSNGNKDVNKVTRIAVVVLAALVAIVLVALTASVLFGNKSKESGFVDKSKYQAVFLNTGQVYFGKINDLNSNYFVVSGIYYLQTSSTGTTTAASAANTSVSLVKLGCELHAPTDRMVINRSQVTFWENLQDTGQVANAIQKFVKDNPTGQKCSNTAANSTTNNVQGSTNTTTNTAPTTTTPTTTTKP
ncbi:hypothetical protein H7171_00490 [Candidatus Saccharibacteria bacterium]|nr:hypothetical protein [Candidatus Saccharibacteria bacterium]